MTLAAGKRLGPYEILAPLGAGGMGEVYAARDTRLDRTVAIKVLPSNLSSDPDLRRRFEREARAISQLAHPHICALYDVGREGEVDFIVMERLEGETLSHRLAAGPLSLADTVRFGAQIADALDRAHRAGIVHRDLKPSNVMLTKTGVKLLDFGLARKAVAVGRAADLTSAPTDVRETELTGKGAIAGTLQYMAPEQLEGKEADARTDLFALGAVLYEMATGRKAFVGTSQASLITAIMSSQPPPIRSIAPVAPDLLDRVVSRCLARDPDDRWQSAADVAAALRWSGEASPEIAPAKASSKSRGRETLAWSAAAALAALALFALWRAKPSPVGSAAPTRFLMKLPSSGHVAHSPVISRFAVSPDGRRIAFLAGSGPWTGHRLWIRSLDSLEAVSLPGTDGAISPFWSPDGKHLAFFASGKLQKISAAGGPPQAICESASGNTGSWGSKGVILFSEVTGGRTGILRVSAGGGTPVAVTTPDASRGERPHGWPAFLPDGRHFLLLEGAQNLGTGEKLGLLSIGSIDSSEVKPLVEADSRVVYAHPGYLLFVRNATLVAQRFDPDRLVLSGDAVPLASDVDYFRHTGSGAFSASGRAELLVYERRPSVSSLVWLDRAGRQLARVGEPAIFNPAARLSPDGLRIAASVRDPLTGKRDIWIYDTASGRPTRQTFEHKDAVFPVWSPDGARLAYASFRESPPDIYVRQLATGREELLVAGAATQIPTDWSLDGARIVYRDSSPTRQPVSRLVTLTLGPAAGSEPVPAGPPFNEFDARFSPDGRWMAIVSEESAAPEVYLVPAGGAGERRRVSSAGGNRPRWRRDGRELYYLSSDARLMAVPLQESSGRLEIGEPQALFMAGGSAIDFDPAQDGQRFLFIQTSGEERSSLVVTQDWAAGLER